MGNPFGWKCACLLSFLGFVSAFGQSGAMDVGPVGMDTMAFADVYVFRERGLFPDYWFGVVPGNGAGMSAKVNEGEVHRIRTRRFGNQSWWTSAGDPSFLPLEVRPGEEYYIEMRVRSLEDGKPVPELFLLDGHAGRKQVDEMRADVRVHYCELPIGSEASFAFDLFGDTVNWYLDEGHHFRFARLPSWEIFLRSPLRATLGFRNQWVSATFSETGGIDPFPARKFASKEAFDAYVAKDVRSLLTTTWGGSRDWVRSWEAVSKGIVPWALYSTVVYCELIDRKVPASAGKDPLLIRTAMVVFFWKEEGTKKGKCAALYASERGLPGELRTREQMLEKLDFLLRHFEVMHTH